MAEFKAPCGGILLDDESFEVDGKVIKTKGGGGGGNFRIVLTGDSSDESSISADKTFAEIKAAFEAGMHIELYSKVDDRFVMCRLITTGTTTHEFTKFVFIGENDFNAEHGETVEEWTLYQVDILESGTIFYAEAYV